MILSVKFNVARVAAVVSPDNVYKPVTVNDVQSLTLSELLVAAELDDWLNDAAVIDDPVVVIEPDPISTAARLTVEFMKLIVGLYPLAVPMLVATEVVNVVPALVFKVPAYWL